MATRMRSLMMQGLLRFRRGWTGLARRLGQCCLRPRSARRPTRGLAGWTGRGARTGTAGSGRRVRATAAGGGARGARQPVGERGAATGEDLEARLRVEVAAERELQREGALVVAGRVGVDEELREAGLAPGGDPV